MWDWGQCLCPLLHPRCHVQACTYIYTYTYTYMYDRSSFCSFINAYMHACACIYIHYLLTCIVFIDTYIHACMHVHHSIHVYTYLWEESRDTTIHGHGHIHGRSCMCACMYICPCTIMYVCCVKDPLFVLLCVHTCMHACTYTCIWLHVRRTNIHGCSRSRYLYSITIYMYIHTCEKKLKALTFMDGHICMCVVWQIHSLFPQLRSSSPPHWSRRSPDFSCCIHT